MHWQPVDYVGLAGGVILLFAFWRLNSGAWKVRSGWYEIDNIIAALLLTYYAYEKHAYVSIVLNIIWGIVAFHGLNSFAERRLRRLPSYKRGFRRGHKLRKKLRV